MYLCICVCALLYFLEIMIGSQSGAIMNGWIYLYICVFALLYVQEIMTGAGAMMNGCINKAMYHPRARGAPT